jgi:tricorn protease-like protein
MNKNQRQQGDVIYRKIESLPDGVKEVKKNNGMIVVMHGENGHTHCIKEVNDVDAMFYEKDGNFYLKNNNQVTLEHEEHGSHVIEPGIWEIGQVVEKDWLAGMVRKVID